jgi:hypothetical protein
MYRGPSGGLLIAAMVPSRARSPVGLLASRQAGQLGAGSSHQRMNATVESADQGSHAAFIAHPDIAASLILRAISS